MQSFSRTLYATAEMIALSEPMTDLYRGLNLGVGKEGYVNDLHKHPERVGSKIEDGVGRHWSTNPPSALEFAKGEGTPPGYRQHGVLLHAQVPTRHVLQSGTSEHNKAKKDFGIWDDDSEEHEKTIRANAPIKIKSAHLFSWNEDDEDCKRTRLPDSSIKHLHTVGDRGHINFQTGEVTHIK